MPAISYYTRTDEDAKMAIREAIRFAASQPGATVKSVQKHIEMEVGTSGVALSFHPAADSDGSLREYQQYRSTMFMFMAHGPSGKTVSG